jgi:DNA primase
MSLPPGFLDELRSRTSIAQVVGRKVMWDQRKSNQGKGDMWAPCPFHQEKSASFHVDDRKGYYYCFGCHAKGDAISFVRETENVDFMEAVEILAREAGMPMPARDPQAAQKADRRSQLAEVMEQAVKFFRLQLQTGAGHAARDYLTRRGLDGAALDQFEIGFAPDGWQNLWDHLRGKGVAEDLIMAAGLAKPSAKGGKPYDTFRNRIMFPIRDPRGRAIAFGGRAMDPNDNAKYLNSPQTELFDKGRSLYHHGPAREAAGKGQPLIVAEGYMDVIALALSGFGATVAPLGTAVTEDQLRLMWRMSPEPVIALDGDKAGLNAAYRLIDLALPLIAAGQSLRFALMPEGKDPDDLLRGPNGRDTMQGLIDNALPMVNLLWRRETEGRNFDSPERKAGLDKVLAEKTRLITDPDIRKHYDSAFYQMKRALFFQPRPREGRPFQPRGRGWTPTPLATAENKSSFLAVAEERERETLHEAVVLAVLVRYPDSVVNFEAELERLECLDPLHASLRMILLQYAHNGPEVLLEEIHRQIGEQGLAKLTGRPHLAIVPALKRQDSELAELTVRDELTKLNARRGHRIELEEALADMDARPSEALTYRLKEATEARNRAERSQQEDRTEYEIGPNGAAVSRDERKRFEELLQTLPTQKPRG